MRELDSVYITELGYVMIRVYHVDENRYVKYILGKIEDDIYIPSDKINKKI